jgi:hypothetical protein
MYKLRKESVILGMALSLLVMLPTCSTLFRGEEKVAKKGQFGWLSVSSKPTGVDLLFGGKYKYDVTGNPMTTPCTVEMEPGFYDLWLRFYEYEDWRDTVRITAKETTKVSITLRPLYDEAHRRKQGETVFALGTAFAVLLLAMSLFMRNVDFK